MAIISLMMTYSSFYITVFPIGLLSGMHSYSIGGEKTDSWEILHSYHGESQAASFDGVADRERNTWIERHPGYEMHGCPDGGLAKHSLAI